MDAAVLQRPTLVLNRHWQPVRVTTVARALVQVWNATAHVIDPVDYQLYTWADWSALRPREGEPAITTPRLRLRVPEVVTLTTYDRLPILTVPFNRRNVFQRDRCTCQYCGAQPGSAELTIDHVIPRSHGGVSSWENCVLACVTCNRNGVITVQLPGQTTWPLCLYHSFVGRSGPTARRDSMTRLLTWCHTARSRHTFVGPVRCGLRKEPLVANPTLFSSLKSLPPRADTHNEAGGRAYTLPPKHALAQLAATGCFNSTYYTSADTQLNTLLGLIDQVDGTVFLAKLAVYSRERAFMKDMPAALLVALSKRDPALMHRVFDRVVDSGRVLRTVFQMIRSGQFGRTCLSASLQRAFQRWLNEASVGTLLSASIGQQPSLCDVLRLARPTPKDNMRRALFGWLTDKEVSKWAPATAADLPEQVQALSAYRQATTATAQVESLRHLSVRWDLLAEAAQAPEVWKMIARQMGPQALRMNLNTLLRHEVLQDRATVAIMPLGDTFSGALPRLTTCVGERHGGDYVSRHC